MTKRGLCKDKKAVRQQEKYCGHGASGCFSSHSSCDFNEWRSMTVYVVRATDDSAVSPCKALLLNLSFQQLLKPLPILSLVMTISGSGVTLEAEAAWDPLEPLELCYSLASTAELNGFSGNLFLASICITYKVKQIFIEVCFCKHFTMLDDRQ
jgi:hypothetical protein